MTYNSCFRKNKISSLQSSLEDKALLLEDPTDLYYLTGLNLSAGQLWLSSKEALLLVDGRYIESAGKAPCKALLLSSKEIKDFLLRNKVKHVKFDGAKTSFERAQALQKKHPDISFSSQPFATKDLRLIKEPSELESLQKSADLLWGGFLYIQTLLCEGISEKEVATKFTVFCLERGAERLSFDPIIAFGEGSAMPHYRAGDRKLKKGDVILIDIGVSCDNYHSDMTRMLFYGAKNPTLAKWYDIVLEAQKASLDLCKAGLHIKELDIAARAVFKKHQVEEYYVHSLGHGVGLEVHEFPKIRFDALEGDLTLKPGMVFTIEPGLYLPGTGGIRYEDTIFITEDGYTSFTP
jgi:Xaa-Pro aminopeptidase